MPEPVLRRAEGILAYLTRDDARSTAGGVARAGTQGGSVAADAGPRTAPQVQLSLFNEQERDALDALRT